MPKFLLQKYIKKVPDRIRFSAKMWKKYIKKFEEPKKENTLILNLDNYPEIPFEDLLNYATFIIDYYYKNKIELTLKHRDNVFYLNQNSNSLNQILSYLSDVQN